jgi:hypothetical protein
MQGETFTIVRYRAPSPTLVSPSELQGQELNGVDAVPVLLR